MKNPFKFFFAILFISVFSFSQEYTIKGSVSDKNSKETIPMVNIVLKSNNTIIKGTVSNMNGEYSMTFIKEQNENYVIEFSFIGYSTEEKEVLLKKNKIINLDIQLAEESSIIDVVVISAGKFEQKLEEVTVSMDVIKPTLLESKNSVNMENLMNQAPEYIEIYKKEKNIISLEPVTSKNISDSLKKKIHQ